MWTRCSPQLLQLLQQRSLHEEERELPWAMPVPVVARLVVEGQHAGAVLCLQRHLQRLPRCSVMCW